MLTYIKSSFIQKTRQEILLETQQILRFQGTDEFKKQIPGLLSQVSGYVPIECIDTYLVQLLDKSSTNATNATPGTAQGTTQQAETPSPDPALRQSYLDQVSKLKSLLLCLSHPHSNKLLLEYHRLKCPHWAQKQKQKQKQEKQNKPNHDSDDEHEFENLCSECFSFLTIQTFDVRGGSARKTDPGYPIFFLTVIPDMAGISICRVIFHSSREYLYNPIQLIMHANSQHETSTDSRTDSNPRRCTAANELDSSSTSSSSNSSSSSSSSSSCQACVYRQSLYPQETPKVEKRLSIVKEMSSLQPSKTFRVLFRLFLSMNQEDMKQQLRKSIISTLAMPTIEEIQRTNNMFSNSNCSCPIILPTK